MLGAWLGQAFLHSLAVVSLPFRGVSAHDMVVEMHGGPLAASLLGRRHLARNALEVVGPSQDNNVHIITIIMVTWGGLLIFTIVAALVLRKISPGLAFGAPGSPLFAAPLAAPAADTSSPDASSAAPAGGEWSPHGNRDESSLLEEGLSANSNTGGGGGGGVRRDSTTSMLAVGIAAQQALDERRWQQQQRPETLAVVWAASLDLLCSWRSVVVMLHALIFSPRAQALRILYILTYDFAWCTIYINYSGPKLALIVAAMTSAIVLARFALSHLTFRSSLKAVEALLIAAQGARDGTGDASAILNAGGDAATAAAAAARRKKPVVMTALVVNPDGELVAGRPDSASQLNPLSLKAGLASAVQLVAPASQLVLGASTTHRVAPAYELTAASGGPAAPPPPAPVHIVVRTSSSEVAMLPAGSHGSRPSSSGRQAAGSSPTAMPAAGSNTTSARAEALLSVDAPGRGGVTSAPPAPPDAPLPPPPPPNPPSDPTASPLRVRDPSGVSSDDGTAASSALINESGMSGGTSTTSTQEGEGVASGASVPPDAAASREREPSTRGAVDMRKLCCCCILLPLWPLVGALTLAWGVCLGLLVLICWGFFWPATLDRTWGLPPAFMAAATSLFAYFKCIPTVCILLVAYGEGIPVVESRWVALEVLLLTSVCLNLAALLPVAFTAVYTGVLRPWSHLEILQMRLLPLLQAAISEAQRPPPIPLLQAAVPEPPPILMASASGAFSDAPSQGDRNSGQGARRIVSVSGADALLAAARPAATSASPPAGAAGADLQPMQPAHLPRVSTVARAQSPGVSQQVQLGVQAPSTPPASASQLAPPRGSSEPRPLQRPALQSPGASATYAPLDSVVVVSSGSVGGRVGSPPVAEANVPPVV